MKKRLFSLLTTLVMVISLVGVVPAVTASVQADNTTNTYNVEYSYKGKATNKTKNYSFNYSHSMFFQDANIEHGDVAKVAVGLATAAYNKEQILKCFKEMGGFETDNIDLISYQIEATYNYNDFVAYSIGHKEVNGKHIFIVPVRGTTANDEWFNNFKLGTGDNHEGFYASAKRVKTGILNAIDRYGATGKNTILLITGHSRGAAVSNIVAGELSDHKNDNGLNIPTSQIFGYTFACPSVSKNANTNLSNIYNYNNPGDLIVELPLKEWGFERYGKLKELQFTDDIFNRFQESFKNDSGKKYAGLNNTDDIIKALKLIAPTQKAYNSNDNHLIFDIVAIALMRHNLDADKIIDFITNICEKNGVSVFKLVTLLRLAPTNDLLKKLGIVFYLNNKDEITAVVSNLDEIMQGHTGETYIHWINATYPEFTKASEGDFEYKLLSDGTVQITKYKGSSTNLSIPSTINGKKVTHIGDYAFAWCSSLTSINIPNSVTSIGEDAFAWCSSLTSINIPNSVTSIGEDAFLGCSSLTSITIPDSVTSIGEDAFLRCSSLTSINVDDNNEYYSSQDGVLFNKDKTELMQYPMGNTRASYTIPNSVTSIDDRAFWECSSLTSINIPNSVTSIGRSAFRYCSSLTSITIPDSVTSIGDYAFAWCSSLTSITIGNGVTSIGEDAFYKCTSLTSITIGNGVTSIGDYAFGCCESLTSINIPNSVTSIDYCAFEYCTSLTSINIPNSVTSIGHGAFYYCRSLKDVYYSGSEEEWNKIKIGSDNSYLTNATIHFKEHTHNYKTTKTKATLTKNGSIVEKCTVCGTKKSTTAIYYPKTFTLAKTSYVYNGKVQKPAVTVKDSKGKVIAKSNYTVTYSSGCKNVGKYAVKVTFKGNYSGAKMLYYTIIPKGTAISRLTSAKRGFTAVWAKNATQTTGYQIQYTTDSKFKSGVKTVTINKNTTVSKVISKLTGGKKYYVRVRTYRNANKVNYFSAWSGAKAVTTKK